ncbi:MAG: hypothetical protein JXM73_07845, partial [Anaerolineae bacterium]|nr:hypothetical protein [Anaerolineae bacterium]
LPSGSETSGETALDPFHNETMQRIRLIRKLFPGHEAYASHGYGHRLGGLESPFDDSTDKEGIPAAWLPPLWPVRLNAIATGLALYRFRPETWPEYVDQVLDTRRFVLTCLNQLLLGLNRYLQRNTPTNLFGGNVDAEQWDHCRTLLGGGSPLPKCAVDPWGLAHEGLDTSALPQEQTGSQAIALLRYKPYLRAWRDYTFSLAAFFQQAPHVMVTTYRAGKLPAGSPEKARALDLLHKHGVKTELANLSTDNLFEAQTKLPRYQRRFDALFGSLGGEEALPKEEVGLVGRVWQMWYYFAHRPAQMWALPQKQIPNEITIEQDQLEKGIRQEIAHLTSPDLHVTVLPMESGWEDTSALWLRMDLEHPTKTYTAFTELVQALRRAIGHVEFQKLGYYIVERNWPYIVIVPVVQGRMFRPFAWRLHTLSTILARKDADEATWIYVPKPIPSENWAELGLVLWEHEDLELANRLSDAVGELSFLAARVSDLRNIPALTEPGLRAVQMHLEKQSKAISQQLQTVFDTIAAMADRFGHLTEQDRESRPQLTEAVAGLVELHKLVRPAEEFEERQVFEINELCEYTARLEQARPLAEAIRLYWLEDVLDQIAAGQCESNRLEFRPGMLA